MWYLFIYYNNYLLLQWFLFILALDTKKSQKINHKFPFL